MALEDGIRRNAAAVSQQERERFSNAFLVLGMPTYPHGVSFRDKENQIHPATHVQGGPAFLLWHHELSNRLATFLRELDPALSRHYWNWTTGPRKNPELFMSPFMGRASGDAGLPYWNLAAKRYFNTRAPRNPNSPITSTPFPIWRRVNKSTFGTPTVASDRNVMTTRNGTPYAGKEGVLYERAD
jgi:hypothetical protein